MIKNTSYTITYSAWDKTDGSVVRGDVANHTCKYSVPGSALVLCTNSPSEVGNGVYRIVLTASETNCDTLTLVVTSTTPGVIIPPVQMSFDANIDMATMSENITAIKDRMPQTGTVSTLTARDVWMHDLYCMSDSSTAGICYAHTFVTGIPEQVWTRAFIPLSHTDASYGSTTVSVSAYRILSALAVNNDTTHKVEPFPSKATVSQALAYCSDNNSRLQELQADIEILGSGQNSLTAQEVWEYTNRTLTSEIPTVSEIQSGLAKTTDLSTVAKTTDLSELAKTSDLSTLATASALGTVDTVVDAIKAKTDNLPAQPAAKSDVQITVNADGIDVPTAAENASAVWGASTRTLTSVTGGGGATAQEVWSYNNRTLTSSQSVDMTSVQETLDAIFALLGRWNVSENVLTTYDENGNTLQTYTLTRDADGNITRVEG